uniref:Uncharacterized protein n=1 Tax=Fundulus heteroclitus TaxID=8078 RepID=A0A3Q2QZR8_FUNHE
SLLLRVFPSFILQLISDLATFFSSYLCDALNCLPNSNIDTSPNLTRSKKSETINEFCKGLDVYYIWRVLHPSQIKITLFLSPHGTFSRIDCFYLHEWY